MTGRDEGEGCQWCFTLHGTLRLNSDAADIIMRKWLNWLEGVASDLWLRHVACAWLWLVSPSLPLRSSSPINMNMNSTEIETPVNSNEYRCSVRVTSCIRRTLIQ